VVTRHHKVVRGTLRPAQSAGKMGGLTTAGRIGLVPGGTFEQTRNPCESCCTPTAHTHRYSIDLSEFRKMKTDRGSASFRSVILSRYPLRTTPGAWRADILTFFLPTLWCMACVGWLKAGRKYVGPKEFGRRLRARQSGHSGGRLKRWHGNLGQICFRPLARCRFPNGCLG
jgi:hypothetical protein